MTKIYVFMTKIYVFMTKIYVFQDAIGLQSNEIPIMVISDMVDILAGKVL